jgi:hypothetical protein
MGFNSGLKVLMVGGQFKETRAWVIFLYLVQGKKTYE